MAEIVGMFPGEFYGATCRNCGKVVGSGTNDKALHTCEDADILEHHVSLLSRECAVAYGITRTPTRPGKHDPDPLVRWGAFDRWTETNEGRFAQFCAERARIAHEPR
jgi:hypothetical protein